MQIYLRCQLWQIQNKELIEYMYDVTSHKKPQIYLFSAYDLPAETS